MRLLICDDVRQKVQRIENYFDEIGNYSYKWVEYEDQLMSEIEDSTYDIILLDMTLPKRRNCGKSKIGGKEIIYELCDRDINIPVIIITCYSDFHENSKKEENNNSPNEICFVNENYKDSKLDYLKEKTEDDILYIDILHRFMSRRFPIYVGTVFMNETSNDWKDSLKKLIDYAISK